MRDAVEAWLWRWWPKVVEHDTCGDCDRCIGGRPEQCHVQVPIRRLWLFG